MHLDKFRLSITIFRLKFSNEEAKEKGRINFFRGDGISNNSCYSSGSYHCLQDREICIIHANFRIT